MKPDLDDYEELNDEQAPRSRAMSWLVLTIAVGGFAALAYYAYHSGTTTPSGDMLVVQADETPIKETPADPEGEQFPNKDKTIYDVIAPNGSDQKVEKLLPDPEHPMVTKDPEADEDVDALATTTQGNTTTYVNKSLGGTEPEAAPAAKPVEVAKPAPAIVAKVEPAPETKSVGEPTFINEKPASAKKESPAVEVKPAPKAAPAGGSYKIQLGAYKSEEEALANWKKISGKFSDVVSGEPIIVKADLPNGTFYRLRATGFVSAESAKAACTKLSAKGQACFPAGK